MKVLLILKVCVRNQLSRHLSEGERSLYDRLLDRHSSDILESSNDNDNNSNELNKGTDDDFHDGLNYNPSPLSVDQLAKSDQSHGDFSCV